MRIQSLRIIPATLIALGALATVACGHTVRGENTGDGRGAVLPGSLLPDPGTAGESTNVVAVRYADLAWPTSESGSSVATTSGGDTIDPDTLFIFVSSETLSCDNPMVELDCGGQWEVSISIPPALQQPGTLLLDSDEINSSFSATGPGSGTLDGGDCWFGGGSFWDGAIEILSIEDDNIEFELTDTSDLDFDADGSYDAAICGS